ncbi:MAG: PA14 domain-containing protein, partial [Candidatus Aminicenantales bacterium]
MGLVRLSSSSIDRLTTGTKKKIFVCVSIFIILLLSVLLIRQFLLPRGLTGKFYSSDSWEGFPALIKVNSKIHFQKLAISRLVAYSEKFSVIWEGFIYCPRDSEYFFSTVSDDGSWVYVDDVLIVDNGGRHGAVKKENHVFLSRGNHRIKIKYFDAGGLGVIEFRWRGTHFLAEYLPRLPLFPGPVAESRYRLDRFLTYAQILFLASLFLIGLWLLIIILRMLFTKTDVLSALAACLFFVLLFINGSEIYKNRSTAVNGCDTYAYLQGASLMSQKGIFRTWIEDPLIPLIYHGYKT